jgi:hypothetical protein
VGLHLRGAAAGDPVEAANVPEALDLSARSAHASADVVAAGLLKRPPEELTAVTEVSLAQCAPQDSDVARITARPGPR